jgi:hypothetical protein
MYVNAINPIVSKWAVSCQLGSGSLADPRVLHALHQLGHRQLIEP